MYKETLIARLSEGLEGEASELFQKAAVLCEATEDMSLADVLMELRDGGIELAKSVLLESSDDDIFEDDIEFDEDEDEDIIEDEELDEACKSKMKEDTANNSNNPDRIRPVDAHNPQAVVYNVQSRHKNRVKEDADYHGFNSLTEEGGEKTHIFSGNSSFMKKHLKDVASAHGATVKKVHHEDGVSEYHVHAHPSTARKMGDELEKRDEAQFKKRKIEYHYGGYHQNESYSETIMNRLEEIGKIDEKYQSIEDKAISIEEDVTAMFEGIELTEDFKEKASLIFEAAVARQVNAYKELVNEAIDDVVEEEVAAVTEELTEKIDKYLDYVVEEWIKENELAIETGLRVEVAEDFISGLKNLFAEHFIEVPEGKENLLDTVVAEKEGIEEEFEKAVQKNIELIEEMKGLKKGVIISEMTRDLADTEAEKLEELVGNIEFVDADSFASKVGQVKESYFNRAPKTSSQVIDESEIVTEEVLKEEVVNDPAMKSYVDGLAKFIK